MSTRIYTVFWHRLGPCVTKEELESVYQKIESVTRIFEMMFLFVFQEKNRQADRRRRLRATVMTKRHVRTAPRTPQIALSFPLLVLFVLLGLRLEIRARVVITHAGGVGAAAWVVVARAMARVEARTG